MNTTKIATFELDHKQALVRHYNKRIIRQAIRARLNGQELNERTLKYQLRLDSKRPSIARAAIGLIMDSLRSQGILKEAL